MIYFRKACIEGSLSDGELKTGLFGALDKLGGKKRVLAIPPDFTRFYSKAGLLTEYTWEYYKDRLTDVLPALGTHAPMSDSETGRMFGEVPNPLFRVHDWKNDIVTLGKVPAEIMKKVSEGKLDYSWPAQVNKLVSDGGHDLILSIGQVVPHEVIGMANYNKNIFVGTGGVAGINRSHFLGAVYGLERIMGRTDTPVRRIMNYASEHFAGGLPIVYVLTVVAPQAGGLIAVKGLFIGDDHECFYNAADLSFKVNFTMLDEAIKKVVVHLDPGEFKSTWVGNKGIYRTRMAIAAGGELIVLAPGVKEFGEDKEIDRLIRKYGYIGTEKILNLVKKNDDLQENLSAAAHLIHGSSEGRFTITYCPGHLTRKEIEGVGFKYARLDDMMERYKPENLKEGYNTLPGGEKVYFISKPALGLWACKDRFK
ncbi:MAG: lactate racemase domain-containing protein [Spirochaetota bacterium]